MRTIGAERKICVKPVPGTQPDTPLESNASLSVEVVMYGHQVQRARLSITNCARFECLRLVWWASLFIGEKQVSIAFFDVRADTADPIG